MSLEQTMEDLKNMNFKCRPNKNGIPTFTMAEIAHMPLDNKKLSLLLANSFQMGYMLAVRDNLCSHFKKEVPIKITSGYRDIKHNADEGGTGGSLHIWRFDEDLAFITANDFEPIGVSIEEAYKALSWCKGEIYYNRSKNCIHVAPYKEEPHWIKEK